MFARMVLVSVAVCVLLAGTAVAEEINPVVGKTGDFVIRQADLDRLIASQPAATRQQLQSKQAQAEFVRQILLTRALADRARKEGFDRRPDVQEELSFAIDRFLGNLYLRKVVAAGVSVPDAEVKAYYTEHEKEFVVPAKVEARQIFIEAGKDATAEMKAKARAKAEKVRELLEKGGDFAKLAKEYSEDADSAAKGGELGTIEPGATNSPAFEKALFALKKGEVSPVVETPFGYHIVQVEERQEQRTATFDETKAYIREQLTKQDEQKKVQAFLEKLAKDEGLQDTSTEPAAPAKEGEAPESPEPHK